MSNEYPYSDIELSLLEEQWSLNVFLDDKLIVSEACRLTYRLIKRMLPFILCLFEE